MIKYNVILTDAPQKVPYSDDLIIISQTVKPSFEREILLLDILPEKKFLSNMLKSFYLENIDNRIIIVEKKYQLGEITEEITFNIEIYNSTYEIQTIEAENLIGIDGLEYSFNTKIINPRQSSILTVTVKKDGEPDNNGFFQLTINSVIYNIYFNYTRSNIFNYTVDRTLPISVSYSYLTEILTSLNNKEDRISYLERPRMFFNYNYILSSDDRIIFEQTIINASIDNTFLPLVFQEFVGEFKDKNKVFYDDINYLDLKTNDYIHIESYDRKYSKSYKISLVNKTLKYIEISTDEDINLNNKFVRVMPLVKAKLIGATSGRRITRDLYAYNVSFSIDSNENDKDLISTDYVFEFEKLNDIEVYNNLMNNSLAETTIAMNKNITILDNQISIKKYFTYNNMSQKQSSMSFLMTYREEISKLKYIFQKNQGRFGTFYKYRNDKDLTLLNDIAVNSNSIVVKDMNFYQSFKNNAISAICINYDRHKRLSFEITDVRKTPDGEEIFLSKAININIKKEQINMVMFLDLVRFDNDLLVIEYLTNTVASANLTFRQVIVK